MRMLLQDVADDVELTWFTRRRHQVVTKVPQFARWRRRWCTYYSFARGREGRASCTRSERRLWFICLRVRHMASAASSYCFLPDIGPAHPHSASQLRGPLVNSWSAECPRTADVQRSTTSSRDGACTCIARR